MDIVETLIKQALAEDIGNGDHSSLACVPKGKVGKAQLLVKDEGIIAGVEIAERVFHIVDSYCELDIQIKDGSSISEGQVVFVVSGPMQSILKAERLVLNIMQRMSGIATHTAKLRRLLSGLPTKILDTRKTTPNFRVFEKIAVELGGGVNHRFGLYDMIMLKDNHIDYSGGINDAISKTHQYLRENNLDLKIEVEARNLREVDEILSAEKVDRIMLDNFSYEDLRIAVKKIGNYCATEASGNINEKTIRGYAECGVDYISVGALTHQVKSLDLSLKAIEA